jgi:hypothetical protein
MPHPASAPKLLLGNMLVLHMEATTYKMNYMKLSTVKQFLLLKMTISSGSI